MGFHMLDLIPILLIALVIIGPKALQSISRNMGKGVGQAKEVKDQVLSELPVEEITKVTRQIPMKSSTSCPDAPHSIRERARSQREVASCSFFRSKNEERCLSADEISRFYICRALCRRQWCR